MPNEPIDLNSFKIPETELLRMSAASSDNRLPALNLGDSVASAALLGGRFQYRDVDARVVGDQLRWTCATNHFNRLLANGSPLNARVLTYFFSGIQWTAGRGWPVYSTRCPRTDNVPSMLWPDAKAHQIIVQCGGWAWFECLNSHVANGKEITDVFVGVNDDRFVDNTGSFEFVVTGHSR